MSLEQQKGCAYPYVGVECDDLFKDAPGMHDKYLTWRIVTGSLGLLTAAISAVRLCQVIHLGGQLQKQIFTLLLLSSLTLVVRAVDPEGYGGLLPLSVCNSLEMVGFGFLYTIAIVIPRVWLSLAETRSTSSGTLKTTVWMRKLAFGLLFFLWLNFVALAVFASLSPFDPKLQGILYALLGGLTIVMAIYTVCAGCILGRSIMSALQEERLGTPPGGDGLRISLKEADHIRSHRLGSSGAYTSAYIPSPAGSSNESFWQALTRVCKEAPRIAKMVSMMVMIALAMAGLQLVQSLQLLSSSNTYGETQWAQYQYCMQETPKDPKICEEANSHMIYPISIPIQAALILFSAWIFWKIPGAKTENGSDEGSGAMSIGKRGSYGPPRSGDAEGFSLDAEYLGSPSFYPTEVLVTEVEDVGQYQLYIARETLHVHPEDETTPPKDEEGIRFYLNSQASSQ